MAIPVTGRATSPSNPSNMPTCSSTSAMHRLNDRPDVICEPWHVDFDIAVLEKVAAAPEGETDRPGHDRPARPPHPCNGAVPDGEGNRSLRSRKGAAGHRSADRCSGAVSQRQRLPSADEILFVGTGLFHPIGISLATKKRVIALDPLTGTVQEVSGDALLRRRFAVMEKARGAKTIGIIVSSKTGPAADGTCPPPRITLAACGHRHDARSEPGRTPEPRVCLLCEHRLPAACVRRPGTVPGPGPLPAGVRDPLRGPDMGRLRHRRDLNETQEPRDDAPAPGRVLPPAGSPSNSTRHPHLLPPGSSSTRS